MSRSLLSQFPAADRAVAEYLPYANRPSLRVNKIAVFLMLRANSGRKPELAPAEAAARGFRPLFAAAQSTVSSKLANPLKDRRFSALRQTTAENPPRPVTVCPD
jgi:hypothetical protein